MLPIAVHDLARWLPRESESPLEYWISLSPAAPLFGIPWRFAPAAAAPVSPDRADPAPVAADAPADAPARAPTGAAAHAASHAATGAPAAPGLVEALVATPPDAADDLTRIRGIGPKLAAELNSLGIFSLAQIAALTPEELERIDGALSGIRGRPMRDDWVGQARALLAG